MAECAARPLNPLGQNGPYSPLKNAPIFAPVSTPIFDQEKTSAIAQYESKLAPATRLFKVPVNQFTYMVIPRALKPVRQPTGASLVDLGGEDGGD